MSKNIVVVAGPCAVESEEQVMNMAYKIGSIRDIAEPYGIHFKMRGGAWKPRTSYWVKNNGEVERVFEGVGEIGLKWLSQAAETYSLPIVCELMSEMDLRYFHTHLEPERDYVQIGARNSQNFALLFYVGSTDFNILLKNPQHGVDVKEAVGSLQRLIKNRKVVYSTRGQKKFIHPDGEDSPAHRAYMEELLKDPYQHPDARNLNNIRTIATLRDNSYFQEKGILICHDPSHTWGGKTHLMRRNIGEFAIKAVTEHGYDWIIVEVDDKSRYAKCDADQALLTTLNRVDWLQTHVKEKPPEDVTPITLVDIVRSLINHQIAKGHATVSSEDRKITEVRLNEVRWDLAA